MKTDQPRIKKKLMHGPHEKKCIQNMNIRLSLEDKWELEKFSKSSGLTKSEIIRRCVYQFIEQVTDESSK